MRNLKKLAALTLACAMLPGCAGMSVKKSSGGKVEKDAGEVTISISDWPTKDRDPEALARYEDFTKIMKEKYNVTVQGDTWIYDMTSFLPKAASGQLPTMYRTHYTEVGKIVDAKYAADMTDIIKKYNYDEKYNPIFLEVAAKNDRYYALPISGYVMGMTYNIDLFKKAGLVDEEGCPIYPETYDEITQTAVTIKEKTGAAGIFIPTTNNQGGWIFCNIIWAFGGDFLEKDGDKYRAVFDSKECVDALTWVKDLKWKYNVIQEDILADATSGFVRDLAANKVAMGILSPGNANLAVSQYNFDKDLIAISTTAKGPAERAALTGGIMAMFAPEANEAELDAAVKWMELTGIGPKYDEDTIKAWAASAKDSFDKGLIVQQDLLPVIVDEDLLKAKMEAKAPYVNVDENKFKHFKAMKDVTVHPEPAVHAQELYNTIDSVLQTILTDKNADPQKELSDAVKDFQTNYLDKD